MPIVDPHELDKYLTTRKFGRRRVCLDEIDSTNSHAKSIVSEDSEGTLVWAESQTQGRGRWGKSWHSKPGQSLLFSVILAPLTGVEVFFLQLSGCIAVLEGIRKNIDLPIHIHWPNDLYLNDKKIGGILAETASRDNVVNSMVLGVGLNLFQKRDDFPEPLKDEAISLAMSGKTDIHPARLLADILYSLELEYKALREGGLENLLRRWARNAA
jgi:BirA family transcriptional regulator, biotin operon repressor / biotin---[acetyl-CoA-carboxylase] ligase